MTPGIDHVIVNVKNFERSLRLYDWLMPKLGYTEKVDDTEGDGQIGWVNEKGGSFWLKEAGSQFKSDAFHKDRIGLCEIAFRVERRSQVDELAQELESHGATILDSPREYSYCKGYYAIFFTDPDGIKLEIVHYPYQ